MDTPSQTPVHALELPSLHGIPLMRSWSFFMTASVTFEEEATITNFARPQS
jgi:hypothetical protein